ncbi:MAG: glutathione S-transferase family protein [Pseudomonadales bacterium]
MHPLTLIIANQNYSSWSLRPWLLMKVKDIPFDCELRPFDEANNMRDFFEFSPTGKVPVLIHEAQTLWESLAIMEYLAELYPDRDLWPQARSARATARALASEMHAGFPGLRGHCPMNMRRAPAPLSLGGEAQAQVAKDVARIERIWDEQLQQSGGPFLFGAFGSVDAMFAPVVNRLAIYELSRHEAVARYSAAMTQLPAWQEWESAGKAEPWIVAMDEA